MIIKWIKAMRVHTLTISSAGVLAGLGCSIWLGHFEWLPAILCMVFAVLAQISANFGNEYYDFVNGVDNVASEGYKHTVTEGEITPKAMRNATYCSLIMAAIVGLFTLFYGDWWLIFVGMFIVLFAIAYSAGPYPLSHHGFGDLAVMIFFGLIPVTFTTYLQTGDWSAIKYSLPLSISIGLLATNVLIINNYRDIENDRAVNKITTAVIFGRKVMGTVYLLSGIISMLILIPFWKIMPRWVLTLPALYLIVHLVLWYKLVTVNKKVKYDIILGITSILMFVFSVIMLIFFIICHQPII